MKMSTLYLINFASLWNYDTTAPFKNLVGVLNHHNWVEIFSFLKMENAVVFSSKYIAFTPSYF